MPVLKAKLNDFTGSKEIAAGGEGKIYEHPHDKKKVVKIYHKARKPEFVRHLEKLSKLDPIFFVVPIDIYVDSSGKVLGFSMEYVNFNEYFLFNNLFNKGFCNSNNIDKSFKINVLTELSNCLDKVHKMGITIGDLNQYNLFISRKKSILFVDVDSYQTSDNLHSGVLLDDIRDWTTTDINDKTDIWAYDILAFWATTFVHPYKWVVPGNKESLEMRVRGNKHILSKIPNIKIPALYEPPIGNVYDQFMDIFNGRRFMVDFSGVVYSTAPIIVKQPVSSQLLNIRELYDDVLDIYACENFFSVKHKGNNWVLVKSEVHKITREIKTIVCDDLYPSDSGSYAFRKGDTLHGIDNTLSISIKTFQQPVFYFNNGFLCVIEYPIDLQWNFNINNQLYGIDNTNTPVFAKSIIKRDGLLQNFGSQMYLNVPMYNVYSMIKVPKGTKNAFFNLGYIGVEFRNKNQTVYQIIDTNKIRSIDFDYLPYFAVSGGKTIFVPEEGYIDVYSANLQFLTRFDCSMCTRNSKLFSTKSGIILYEDKTVFLLNTK